MKKICSGITIKVGLIGDGLAGKDLEYKPYIMYYTSFGDRRIMVRLPLLASPAVSVKTTPLSATVQLPIRSDTTDENEGGEHEKLVVFDVDEKVECYYGAHMAEFTLEDFDEMRGDETLNFKLFCHSRFSGVESIDKVQSKYVELQTQCGLSNLSLKDLFINAIDQCVTDGISNLNQKRITFTVTDKFFDDKIVEEKTRQMLREIHKRELEDPNNDVRISDEEFRARMAEARLLTLKASVQYEITLHDFNHDLYERSIFSLPNYTESRLEAYLPLAKTKRVDSTAAKIGAPVKEQRLALTKAQPNGQIEFAPMLYNSQASWRLFLKTTEKFLTWYCDHFMALDENRRPRYEASDDQVCNLQLPQYVSESGKLPLFAYFANDVYYRTYASEEAYLRDLELYGFNKKSEEFLAMMLRSSLRRFGLSEQSFIRAIENHFSPSNTAKTISAHMLLAEEALADTGTFAAHSAYYMADFRLIITTMIKLYTPTSSGGTGMGVSSEEDESVYQKHHHKDIGEVHRCSRCGKELKVSVFDNDSWDHTIENNSSMCDDCEGQDTTATYIIRAYGIGRPDLKMEWESPLMRAAKLLLFYSAVIDCGSLVTSAFMDASNKVVEMKSSDTVLVDSETDRRSKSAGHCHGKLMSLTRAIRMFERGDLRREVIALMKRANTLDRNDAAFQIRDRHRQIIILEPTGSIERVLPLEESYSAALAGLDPVTVGDSLFQKKTAEWKFMKKMKQLLREHEAPWLHDEKKQESEEVKKSKQEMAERESIAELFVGEGLAHYVEKQAENVRTSGFYRSVVQCSSVDLMKRFNITMSQFAVAKVKNGAKKDTYGVRVGELLRQREETKLSFLCPFAKYETQWAHDVLPMVEAVENQMPMPALGRYTDEQYEKEIYSRYISPDDVTWEYDFTSPKMTNSAKAAEARFMKEWATVEKMDSNRTIVRLYSRVWKLTQGKKKTENLLKFIRSMPGLVTFAIYIEKHLPICEPVLEFIIIINVDICLKFILQD